MTISNRSHGRKTDKETQSPVLKIFKEIMKRENKDPEKKNLLQDLQEDRNKKQHLVTKSKSDNKIRDSSSSERHRKNVPFKTNAEQRNLEQALAREAQSAPIRNEKTETWWFSGDDHQKSDEDTCSCVSCALKKICSSENMCICAYLIMFVLSVLLALYLLFKNIPSLNMELTEKPSLILDSERLKRKIEMLKDGMHHKYDDNVKLKGYDERKVWDDSLSNNFDGLSGLSDFGSSSLRELNSLEERNKLSSDLSSIIFNNKFIEDSNSDRLRNFYKKLIQTDERIKNLKKGLTDYNINTNTKFDFNMPDRHKRSLISYRPKKKAIINKRNDKEAFGVTKFNILYPPLHLLNLYTPIIHKKDISERIKRHGNHTRNSLQIFSKDNQLIVHYNPDNEGKKIVPKCSHTPKESKSHEHQLKHPFYKNSQRLDEFLDKFINKKVPRIQNEPCKTDDLFQNSKSPCKHPKIIKDSTELAKGDTNSDKNNVKKDKLKSKDAEYLKKKELNTDEDTTDSYRVVMSISTLLSKDRNPATVPSNQKDPRPRKLMQLDEKDDENRGYEDINEVLDDDTDPHDDNDKEGERIKRMDESSTTLNQLPKPNNNNPLGILNPNWKGPMPLYPDELNSMIKQVVLNFDKIQETLNKDGLPETIEGENELSDMEYVEKYLRSKNDRLVKMAQAYSDYGVLEGKEETIGEYTTRAYDTLEKRVKLSADKRRRFKGGFLGRWKKNNPTRKLSQHDDSQRDNSQPATEGLRFELRPTSEWREDNPKDVFEIIRKHVKIMHNHRDDKPNIQSLAVPADINSYTPRKLLVNDDAGNYSTSTTTDENKFTFNLYKGKRSLQSIDLEPKANNDGANIDADKLFNIEDTEAKIIAANLEIETNNDRIILVKRELNKNKNNEDFRKNENRFIKKIDAKKSSTNVSKIITEVAKNSSNLKENNMNMIFSDFFALLAKWFCALDGVDIGANRQKTNYSSTKLDIVKETNTTKIKSPEIIYPMYDSDMIDNIGHRSRALMSIEDKPNATYEQKHDMADVFIDGKKSTDIVGIKTDKNTKFAFNYTTIPVKAKSQIKTTTNTNAIANKVEKKGDKTKNKTIVKRNAEDSNLIFWNDIYDDEYGVQLDPLENTVKEKDPVMTYNNVMQNSKLWLQTKIKRLKDNMRKSTQRSLTNKPTKKRPSRSIERLGLQIPTEHMNASSSKHANEPDLTTLQTVELTVMHEKGSNLKHNNKILSNNLENDDSDIDKGINFAELTVKMKKVCKEAANAVHKTRNVEVKKETKDESVATSLMQQLVYLMTDLVNFQVQQKTCVKLPSDLSTFLVWLTSPNQVESEPFKMSHHNDAVDILSTNGNDGLPEPIMPSSSEREETHPESRSECLGTLKAVQVLMNEFDGMSDEDRSKMTGVREYLLNQMEYLNQQLYYDVNENFDPQKRLYPIRYKRQTDKYHISKRRGRRAKRKLHKFMKNFGKKHTRSTASFYETIQETECKSEIKNGVRIDNSNDKPKRNLKDVYYKAVMDAKKSTVKTSHREDGKKDKDE